MTTLPKQPTLAPALAGSLDVVVGLGSNLGDRQGTLLRAVDDLRKLGEVRAVSSLYETAPLGPAQPDFLNAAVSLRADHAPAALLAALLEIERAHGRERRERWGPRTLDLDMLWIRGRIIDEPELTVPHPGLASRAFALFPLLDVACDATDPRTGTAYRLIALELDAGGIRRVASSAWPDAFDVAVSRP